MIYSSLVSIKMCAQGEHPNYTERLGDKPTTFSLYEGTAITTSPCANLDVNIKQI